MDPLPQMLAHCSGLGKPMEAYPCDGEQALTPPAPTGWEWHPIDGAICRDGSGSGWRNRFLRFFCRLIDHVFIPGIRPGKRYRTGQQQGKQQDS